MKAGIDYIGISTSFYCNDGQGNFLFHLRSERCRDEHHRWDTGAGKLEFGLTPAENVLKEVREEYGCDGVIQATIPAHSILREWEGARTHWLAIPHFVLVDPAKVRIGEPDKIDELGWFRLDALPDPLHSGFKYSFDHFRSYFEPFARVSTLASAISRA